MGGVKSLLRTLGACVLVGGAALAVASLSGPVMTAAFSTTGESLDLTQRDFRVVNSFSDPESNDNTVKQAEFPGTLGAPLAIRKAHAEWSSSKWAGSGLGDGTPSNQFLGDGGANFDNTWQGVTPSGGTNDNVHIALAMPGGGAFTETPVSDGWRIVYDDDGVTWADGPGTPASGLDLQGVATHEIGHALGLGHSNASGATMQPAITGTGVNQRSIEADDIAGLQSIYGVKAASKPRLMSLSGSTDVGGKLTLHGLFFAATGNEVWFTAAAATGDPLKLTGVTSMAGGKLIDVTLPAGIADGEVLVRASGANNGAVLSNAFPFDLGEGFTEVHPGFAPVGLPPTLSGLGDITPGGDGFSVVLTSYVASVPGLLFVAFAQGAAPFKGGTLYAVPVALTVPVTVNAVGVLTLSATLPVSVPSGTVLVLQAGLSTGSGIQLSNGLRLDIP
jgi:hypothetical protein